MALDCGGRDVLARQIAREEAQRRTLVAFLDGWAAAPRRTRGAPP
ncbi:hypothetical protein AB0E78_41695 [Streptomyces sp. NPDC032198]